MVGVNFLRGSGILLGNYGSRGGVARPLLPVPAVCLPSSRCSFFQVKGNGDGYADGVGKWKMTMGAWPLSIPSVKTAKRVFCKVSRNLENSPLSLPETPLSSSPSSTVAGDKEDMIMVKNAANTLDIRVGRILRAWRHEEADSLYVEEVDIGEPQPRIICSGLVNYIHLDNLQEDIAERENKEYFHFMTFRRSFGMLIAASDASHEKVELLVPPEGSLPGERIWFGSADEMEDLPDAATANQVQKKKIWELVQPHLKTDSSLVAKLGMHCMRTTAGVVACTSLKNANIS
ncbi:hypothetical protein NMG60_11028831 [Bertholletia excelsa]